MPYKIIDSQCTGCSACETQCPNLAISEVAGVFLIDSEQCTECDGHFDEPQCVLICPVDNTCVLDTALPRHRAPS
ncbi:4Fe-4S binding protein [Bradyrhizobium sp. S3.2.6]|uniref:4Fe-4S binding protein n=1 Tax=Bradyrhizobium sp. S3.2.6 TaxID=3156428 RepID=UPI003397126B